MNMLTFYYWILRAIHLNFFVIRRYYGWIQIQIYNPVFPLIKDLIMVYFIVRNFRPTKITLSPQFFML